jgi:aspartate-semialdehyde dehydrogenase
MRFVGLSATFFPRSETSVYGLGADAMSRRIAILGATGLVGRTMVRLLAERQFPLDELRLLASDRDPTRSVEFKGRVIRVEPVSAAAFEGVSLALFASSNAVSEAWAPVARAAGALTVDNSSAFRYRDDVPLVVPEVNGRLLEARPALVANPNCSTIGVVMALAPLARSIGIERVDVSTYQSVSGAGSGALEELERGVRLGYEGDPPCRADGRAPFAFNVVPQIDRFEANGYSREEMKIVWETRKILDQPALRVTATAVRVPVRVGHSAAVTVTLSRPVAPDEARTLWSAFPGVRVLDDPEQESYPTPLQAAGHDAVLVGRVRRDLSQDRGLVFFVASDNLRKGAATNAIQIAEQLLAPRPAAVPAPGPATRTG